jgi:hypothetical protein
MMWCEQSTIAPLCHWVRVLTLFFGSAAASALRTVGVLLVAGPWGWLGGLDV